MSARRGSGAEAVPEKKRKPIRSTIEVKKYLIAKHESGTRVADLAAMFSMPKSTVCTILKNKEAIKAADVAKGVKTLNSRRSRCMEEMEKGLLAWISEKRLTCELVSEGVICDKAKELHDELAKAAAPDGGAPAEDFKASRGWFENFKKRTGIYSVYMHGDGTNSETGEKVVRGFISLPDDTNYHPPISDDTYSDTGSNRDEEESMCADGQDSAVPAPFVAETTPRSIISINNSNSSSTTKKRPRHEAPPASSASSAEACDEQWKLNERGGGYFVEAAAAPPAVAECYTARSAAQIFCDSCAVKMDRLPAKTQSFLQYQIAQLFFNAENPDVTPVTIIPLPEHCRASSAPQGVDKTT